MKHHAAKTKKKRKSAAQKAVITLMLLLVGCLGALVFLAQRKADREVIAKAGTSENADQSSQFIVYKGEQFPVIRNLSTVLLIGTDNFVDDTKQFAEETYWNPNLADFLTILIFDHDEKTVTPFQLNRDTICDVSRLDKQGKPYPPKREAITYAHMYGTGKDDSCLNTVRTVRNLLYNAPIDHYLAFTMDAIPLLNDLVGGVTLTLPEDIPDLGKEYVKGAEITLRGSETLRFIRYREKNIGGSNWERMARHRLYFAGFTEAARAAVADDQDFVIDAFKLIDPFLCTDLTVNNISDMVSWLCEYEIKQAITPTGSIRLGESHYEFTINEVSLWKCIYQAYCRKA